MKRLSKITVRSLIIIVVMMTAGVVSAREILDGERCYIPEDRVVTGDLFVLCGDLIVEGRVEGHIIGAARTATIHGTVEGSIYILGGELSVQGSLGKDLHFVGLTLKVEEEARFLHEGGAILSANLSNTVLSGATVPGNISNVGYQLIIDGDVGHEISFWGSTLNISGRVGGDVTATVGNSESGGTASQIETLLIPLRFDIELRDPGLILAEGGSINGQLEYTGPTEGIIRGETAFPPVFNTTRTPVVGNPVEQSARTLGNYIQARLREFIALMFVAALCLLAIPRQIQAPIIELQAHPISTLGVGMLSFILSFPIVLILAILSLFFMFILAYLPLEDVTLFSGIVLGLANIGAASVFYFTAIYIARVVVALALGRFIVRMLRLGSDGHNMRTSFLHVAVGFIVLTVLGSAPLVGKIFTAIALFLGLGAILSVVRAQIQHLRESSGSPTPPPPIRFQVKRSPPLPYFPEDAVQFAPPIIDEPPDAIGSGNLPEGFNWWGETD